MIDTIRNTTLYLRDRLGIEPRRYFLHPAAEGALPAPSVGIILGSGLGALSERMEVLARIEYGDLPDFPRSTVQGHSGALLYGRLGGKSVVMLQGRVHYYEGYSIEQVALPARVLCCLGIDTLIVSNAAGGLSPLFRVGDLMVIDDHINLLPNPLVGPNLDELGVRFPDMSQPYDRDLIRLAHRVAGQQGVTLRQGCYVGSSGPTFETPAEYRYFRAIGADATGMSTTPETIVARHQGVRVLGFSLISNVGIGDAPDAGVGSHADVIRAGAEASQTLSKLVERIVENL